MSLLRRDMACQELVELVTAYFEDALSGRERRSFEAHIAGCDHCNAYLEEMRMTIDATGRLSEEDIAPQARDELLRAFRDWRRERTA
jgi:anti-sigma factor RsiW